MSKEEAAELIGTTEEREIPEEWKELIWKCPSCKYWFPIDWNHDDEVCCACAGCTIHPFLHKMVDCQCPRCKLKTRYGKDRDIRDDIPAKADYLAAEKELEDWAKEPIPDDFFPPAPEGESVPITDLMTPEEREAWRARVKQFEEREDEA